MEFSGKYLYFAQREHVWSALNDVNILQKTIPGCQNIQWVSECELEAAIKVNLGVANPVFVGDLKLLDVDPATSYVLEGSGRGMLLGRASGRARINLVDHPKGTVLAFKAEGGASGQILALGKSLIGKSAQRVIDGFFVRFGDAMGVELTSLSNQA